MTIAEAYKGGERAKDISNRLGIPLIRVYRAIKSEGVEPHWRTVFRTAQDLADVRAMYESRKTLSECGREYGCHRSTVANAVISAGGTLRSNGRIKA
jgi:hypothetical protein